MFELVKAVHIIGVLFAFSAAVIIPLLVARVERQKPKAASLFYDAIAQTGRLVATPGMVLVLISGLYLALKADVFTDGYVIASVALLVALFGIYGALIIPRSEELAKIAEGVVAKADEHRQPVDLQSDPEFSAASKFVFRLHTITIAIVVLSILVMTLRPGA